MDCVDQLLEHEKMILIGSHPRSDHHTVERLTPYFPFMAGFLSLKGCSG